jgi:hypothetical protein
LTVQKREIKFRDGEREKNKFKKLRIKKKAKRGIIAEQMVGI